MSQGTDESGVDDDGVDAVDEPLAAEQDCCCQEKGFSNRVLRR